MRLSHTLLTLGSVCVLATAAIAQTPAQLMLTTPAQLVDCAPVTQNPCLSAGVTPANMQGKPAPIALPSLGQLADSIDIRSGSTTLKPFYANAGTGPDAAQHINVVLLLVDISGSMNQSVSGGGSRFTSAKGAIEQYLQGMQEGSDRIAIVPFESHGVVPTIRSAVFASRRGDAISQLNALPQPETRNNTALYQAIFSGIQAIQDEFSSLRREGHAPDELQPHLIVMTDGKNDVRAGDDIQLLDGPLGLQQAVAQVQASHIDVIGIGFGERDAIDTAALQRLSTRFFYAADANQLLDALHVSRSSQSHEIIFTWLLPEANRLAVSGRDQAWIPTIRVDGKNSIVGAPIRYIPPAMAQPNFDRVAMAAELQSLIATHPAADAGWSTVLINVLLFVIMLALILLLWFWVPRLIWGDRYAGALPTRRRWSSDRPSTTAASGVQVRYTEKPPLGFESEVNLTSPLQRSAAQTTQVQLRNSHVLDSHSTTNRS
ncbi:MAG TPA: vWA domain-containing protein [Edaphobacter sp.]|nr:vWA domain-containing protein [Edaphobacter sp.]